MLSLGSYLYVSEALAAHILPRGFHIDVMLFIWSYMFQPLCIFVKISYVIYFMRIHALIHIILPISSVADVVVIIEENWNDEITEKNYGRHKEYCNSI